MTARRLPLLLLLAALALAAVGGALWWLKGGGPELQTAAMPGQDAAQPADDAAPSAFAVPQAPAGEVERTSIAVANAGTEADGVPLEGASWIEGRVRFQPATPADERAVLVVVGFEEAEVPQEALADRGRSATLVQAQQEPHRVARVPVAADGTFRAPVAKGLRSAALELEARYAFLEQPATATAGAKDVVLETKLGGRIVGRVELPSDLPSDASAAELVGAQVELFGWIMRRGSGRSSGHSAQAKLGDALAFEFGGLPDGLNYMLRCDPVVFVPAQEMGVKVMAGETVERSLVLKLGATITGTVLDESGAPVGQAQVAAETRNQRTFSGRNRQVYTGSDGHFALRGVPPGKLALSAEHEGFVRVENSDLELADRQRVDGFELRLTRGAGITGKVLFPDGKPAAGASVRVEQSTKRGGGRVVWSRDDRHNATAGEDGSFSVSGLSEELCDVRAALRDPAAPPAREGAEDAAGTWTAHSEGVKPGAGLVLTLAPPCVVKGRVVDDLGAPVAKFRVAASESGREGDVPGATPAESRSSTGADGTFELPLPPGKWSLTAKAEGYGASAPVEVKLPESVAPVELVLPRAGAVAGQVLDPSGAPVPGATVTLVGASEGRRGGRGENTATADERGEFRFEAVPPGSVALSAKGEGWAASERVAADVIAGETAEKVQLFVRVGGRITGEVFGEGGKPDASREVMAQNLSRMDGSTESSDASGRFTFEHVEPGKYQIVAMPRAEQMQAMQEENADPSAFLSSFKAVSVEVADGETAHVVLGAPPKAPVRLTGHVTVSGRPFAKGMVIAVAEGENMLQAMKADQTDDAGVYELALDHAGDYTLIVGRQLGDDQSVEFHESVPETGEHAIDLALPLAGIAGRVLGPEGRPLPGQTVTIESDRGLSISNFGNGRNARSGEDGAFSFEFLKPGTYTLRAGGNAAFFGDGRSSYGVAVRAGVVVAENRITDGVELRLAGAGRIAGAVRTSDGKPVEGASLFVRDSEGRLLAAISNVQSDATGHFVYEGVPAGSVTVAARQGTLASAETAPIAVREGEESHVDLRLDPGTLLVVTVEDGEGKLVRATVSVLDDRGREVGAMLGVSAMEMLFTTGFSSKAKQLGPFPAGKYKVSASSDDGKSASKMVTLSGQDQRTLTLRLKD